jgi:hypothetical protein
MTKIQIQKIKDDIIALKKCDEENIQQHKDILGAVEKISNKLDPILETFNSTRMLGKWVMAILVFISILIGIILGWSNILNIFKK